MINRREFAAASLAAIGTVCCAADPGPSVKVGLLLYSYGRRAAAEKDQGFATPSKFLEFARSRGANAVQMPLGRRDEKEAGAVRAAAEKLGMALEGIVSPPKDGRADLERFRADLASARACGAVVVRTVLSPGRRYEVFETAAQYTEFAANVDEMLKRAEPVAAAAKIVLAVENHKDFRTDEMVDLLKKFGSDWVGVCLDTGNNLALLEDPLAVVTQLAPFTRTVHLKDIGVEASSDGFRMAEVPLGKGTFDLKAMVEIVRKANPKARFQLEMITRDPLSIPCLGEKYWATFDKVKGRDLARTLTFVRQHAAMNPLPLLSKMRPEEQLELEDRNVRESLIAAAKIGLA